MEAIVQQNAACRKKPELLAPGGSLSQALWALEGGADAIYAGWKHHSARAGAENLDIPEFTRLISQAHQQGARVYATFNTLLDQPACAEASEVLWKLWYRGLDGVIVQDTGLAAHLRRQGPPLDLHASTQMAVQDARGAAMVRDLGFSRVVLARELTLEEIRDIRRKVPDIELEVFVAGAQCYSASGQCQASMVLCDRSANRGACAQICRNRLDLELPAPPGLADHGLADTHKEGTFFSMNDLNLLHRAQDLAEAGINSLKIEGRMKGPLYARSLCRAWRYCLDHPGEGPRSTAVRTCLDQGAMAFARLPGSGFSATSRGTKLINNEWAGSTGIPAGKVITMGAHDLVLEPACPLLAKDGILILWKTTGLRCGLKATLPMGKKLKLVPALDDSDNTRRSWKTLQDALKNGQDVQVRKVSDHSLNLPEFPPGLEAAKSPKEVMAIGGTPEGRALVRLECRLDRETGNLELESSTGWNRKGPKGPDGPETGFAELARTSLHSLVPTEVRTGSRGLDESLAQIFQQAPGELEWLELSIAPELSERFLPPGSLKELRRQWKAALEAVLEEKREIQTPDAPDALGAPPTSAHSLALAPPDRILPRSALGKAPDGLPFLSARDLKNPDNMAVLDLEGSPCRAFSILPLSFSDQMEELQAALKNLLDAHPDTVFLVGLNNFGHVHLVRELAAYGRQLRPWADQLMNISNPGALGILRDMLPDLWGWMPALEARLPGPGLDSPAPTWPEKGLTRLFHDPDFDPPVFYSRSCFRYQSRGLPCPLDSPGGKPCPGIHRFSARQNKHTWRMLVKECMTFSWISPGAPLPQGIPEGLQGLPARVQKGSDPAGSRDA